ncbi:MAG: phosphate acyltransferase [Mangrovibacterium sp.]
MMRHMTDILAAAGNRPKQTLVLTNGTDRHSLEAVYLAAEKGLVRVIVTGNREKIGQALREAGIPDTVFRIAEAADEVEAVRLGVRMVCCGEAGLIMKGLVSSDIFMRALLNKQEGLLPPGGILSHITVVENDYYSKLLLVSDVAVIPYPDIGQKKAMIGYLITTARALGTATPRVALIAPSERVLTILPATTDAAALVRLAREGAFPGSYVDGPMALDVAVDAESAAVKHISSPVAGQADCLLFPNIDAGNVFYKASTKLCHSRQGAMVVGAKAPVVLSSRGDSTETKLYSIALASLVSKQAS